MSETSGSKQRLLIVDDSKVIRVTARKILQNRFETVEAVDGNNAWEILNSQAPFSLIVSDLTMPNLDGFGLLDKVRSSNQPHIRNIPVIIITGANDSEATMQRATAAGATDFIGKPFDSVHLLARTQAHAGAYDANNTLVEENLTLEDRSHCDTLTGLANDTALMEKGCSQLAYAIRHDTSLALAGIEIDDFGDLVRTHGEEAGELVIKSVGSALQANIRKEDVAARTGTARFALLLPGMDTGGVNRLSARITADIGKHAVIVGGKQVRFTVSIGIAAPEILPDTSFDDLLAAAAGSLKEAMARGGNRVLPAEQPPAGTSAAEEGNRGLEAWSLEPLEDKATFTSGDEDDILPGTGNAEMATAVPAQPAVEELVMEAEASTTFDEVVLDALPDRLEESAADMQSEPLLGEIALEEQSVPVLDDLVLDDDLQTAGQTETAYTAGMSAEHAAEDMEETIVITSPYNLFDLDEVELDSSAADGDTVLDADSAPAMETRSAPVTAATPIHTANAQAPADDESELDLDFDFDVERPGILRRLFGALFGRRR